MIIQKTLRNGMVVALEYLPHVQSAAIGIWVRAGAVDESPIPAWEGDAVVNPVKPGISHFIEHMMFKGTEKRSAKDIAEDIDRTGGAMNAFTGQEATCYYVKTLSGHIDTAVDVLSDMITRSVFDEGEMDKEKGVIIEEINMIEDSPEDIGQDLITETVFAGAALGHRIIGTKESVAAIGRQDILSYVKARYTAGNMVISVAGNFDEAALMDSLEEAFGGLTSGDAARRLQTADHQPDWVARKKDIEQSHIFLGKRGVHLMSDNFYSYLLYSSILGGGMSSRLFQNVRENKGLAYSVYSVSSSFVEDGIFLIYAGVGLERERETLEAIRVETELLADEGVGEDELQKVREQYKGHYIFGQENVSTRMFSTGRNMLLLGRTFGQEEVVAGVDAVSRADIAAIAAECADLNDYSGVLISGREIPRTEMLQSPIA